MRSSSNAIENFESRTPSREAENWGLRDSNPEPTNYESTDASTEVETGNELRKTADDGCRFGCRPSSELVSSDPDLDRVVTAWPGLPDALKAAVLAIVRAAVAKE